MAVLGLGAVVLALGGRAEGAESGVASVIVDETSENVPRDRLFTFEAAAGARNDVVIRIRGGRVEVRDRGASLAAGAGCRGEADGAVSCPLTNVAYFTVLLGDGDDALVVESELGNASYEGGEGDDAISGGAGYESFSGGPGSDSLHGGAGPDLFSEDDTAAADLYDGGAGPDEISYGARKAGLIADLQAGTGPDGDRLNGIESLDGGQGDDVILGSDAPGRLQGSGGDDRVDGRGGADKLYGGDGSDVLVGGEGDDELVGVEAPAPDGADRLDGGPGDDLFSVDPADELTCGPGLDRRWAGDVPLALPAGCEAVTAQARRLAVAIGARGSRGFPARCLRVRSTAADEPQPVRPAACRIRLEVRAYRAGRRSPGRLLARSRIVSLPAAGGTIAVPRLPARRVWAVAILTEGRIAIPLLIP
jgi:hypothetical protein